MVVFVYLFVVFYSLLKAPPFPKYFYFIHQKPIFPFISCIRIRIHFQLIFSSLFYSVLLREVNPTDETDPFFVCLFVVLFFFKLLLFV